MDAGGQRMTVAAIGECMIELRQDGERRYGLGFGGDTLNAAVYLARQGVAVDYATVLGDDTFSDDMIELWRGEGIGTELVVRLPGTVPGLYLIRLGPRGERWFHYWRGEAPARRYFDLPETPALVERLAGHDLIYLSGITLSLYAEATRYRLFDLLDRVRARGGRVAFDPNFRERGWPDRAVARAVFGALLDRADIVLPTFDDERTLFGDASPEATVERLRGHGIGDIVVKNGAEPCLVLTADGLALVPPEPVEPVDTTAAGDSFNAGYLAGRLRGLDPVTAARRGHRIAGRVVQHRGAIIPREAMPPLDPATPDSEE